MIARLLTLLCVGLVAASPAMAEPVPLRDAQGKPLELRASIPTGAGVGLSYLAPGATQFYLGDPVRGWSYLGGAAGAAVAFTAGQHMLFFGGQSYVPPEQIAFEMVMGTVYAWLTVGTFAAVDGYHAIAARQPDLVSDPPRESRR